MATYLGKSCSFCLPRVPFVNCRQFMYLVISLLVLRAGYGIWLYQFLIIAYLFTLLPSLIAHRWLGRQTQWRPQHKAIYFGWLGPELFCLLLGSSRFNSWFSFVPVFQWCCSTPRGSPGVGRNTLFLSSPHLCFIIVFICDLLFSVMIHWLVRKPSRGPNNCMFEQWQKPRARFGSRKTGLSPLVFKYWPFQGGTSVVVPYCYLFSLSVFILWFSYYVSNIF